MKFYADFLQDQGVKVHYIEALTELGDIRKLLPYLKANNVDELIYIDTTDDWLEKRIAKVCLEQQIAITKLPSPLFLNTPEALDDYFAHKKRYFQTDFYKHQRQKRNILLDAAGNPVGEKMDLCHGHPPLSRRCCTGRHISTTANRPRKKALQQAGAREMMRVWTPNGRFRRI